MAAIFALLICYLTKWISPSVNIIPSFFALGYPVILAVNILFALFWLILLRKVFIYSTIAIALGWSFIGALFSFNFGNDSDTTKVNCIDVTSYNVHLFSLPTWLKTEPQFNEITTFLNEQNADIISLQEFSTDKTGEFTERKLLKALKKYKYHHIHYTTKNSRNYGLAMFSKHRIIGTGIIHFPNSSNGCIYTDIKIATDTVRVYNIHLQSVRFDKKENSFLDNISESDDNQKIEGIKLVATRLQKAFIKRATQAQEIKEHINSSKYKTIVCGDFNATPSSYTYNHLKQNMIDSFIEAGKGTGATFEKGFPWLRIDYILTDKSFQIESHNNLSNINSSDHFPISARIRY